MAGEGSEVTRGLLFFGGVFREQSYYSLFLHFGSPGVYLKSTHSIHVLNDAHNLLSLRTACYNRSDRDAFESRQESQKASFPQEIKTTRFGTACQWK